MEQYHWAGKMYSLICRQKYYKIPSKNGTITYYAIQVKPGPNQVWKGTRESVHNICSKCHTHQFLKLNKRNYGILPAKQAVS